MKHIKSLSAIFVIAILLSSCKGDTGPAGPAGANGVANITTGTASIPPVDWFNIQSGQYGYIYYWGNITNTSQAGMEVFISEDNNTWFGIPLNNFLSSGDEISYSYKSGQVALIYSYTAAPTVQLFLKVVVIPPAMQKRHPNTNWNNYTEISAVQKAEATSAK